MRVCAIDLKKQFPSPLILPTVKFQLLMATNNKFDLDEGILVQVYISSNYALFFLKRTIGTVSLRKTSTVVVG